MTTSSAVSSDINVDTFSTFSDALQAAALNTTRLAATSLPSDLSFHRSIDPALASDVDAFSERVLSLTSRLVRLASGKTGRVVEEEDDVVDEFVRNIVDSMEGMLESTDSALDVFLGKKKDPAIHIPAVPIDPRQSKPKKPQPARGRLDPALTHASHIPKPQLLFKHTVPNTDEAPYIPAALIPHKWCAKVPLGYVFHDEKPNQDNEDARDDVDEEERRKRAIHPYYYELTHPSYPDHAFNPPMEPSPPPTLDMSSSATTSSSHPLTFVSTPKALLALANTVSTAKEIAIDLEHHSYRSYRGFLALMQISTRQADFVVDLLVPEVREGLRQAKGKGSEDSEGARIANEAGQIIARVFADPSVIKVFHGAESDIVWLQQDFNLFVVGLFDTFHASRLLELPKHSLANLLETFCEFIPDKRYQLADWRIRPLPNEMLTYARSDTHFLLYIYDTLRLLLIEKVSTSSAPPPTSDEGLPVPDATSTNPEHSFIHGVLTRSLRTALRLYEVDVYDAEGGTGSGGWDTLAKKWNKVGLVGSTSREVGKGAQASEAAVYRAVHRWREQMAREEDESTRYVLSTHHLFLLAERIPTTIPELLSLIGGPGGASGSVPPVLKRRAGDLAAVIKDAMDAITSNSGRERSSRDESKDVDMVAPVTVEQPATTTPSNVQPTSESRLWVVGSSSTSSGPISVSRSSLFGVAVAGEQVRVQAQEVTLSSAVGSSRTYSASSSMLFGGALTENALSSSSRTKSTLTTAQISNASTERFRYLVEKIHKTLVIAPVVSLPAISAKTQEPSLSDGPTDTATHQVNSTTSLASDPIPPGPAGQVEIPFVPAHKRQTHSNPQTYTPLEDDTIVVVGQPGSRQRKRRREKTKGVARISPSNPGAGSGAIESSALAGDHDREVEEFDYSSVPNLLDSEGKAGYEPGGMGEADGRKKKKQKQAKGSGLFEYGSFRAPPRDQREVKSGNKTHTFR